MQPLCPLCLRGCCTEQFLNHRGTEDTEVAQRSKVKLRHYLTNNSIDKASHQEYVAEILPPFVHALTPRESLASMNRSEIIDTWVVTGDGRNEGLAE